MIVAFYGNPPYTLIMEQLRIIGSSDRDVFIGVDAKERHCVFSLTGEAKVELGDTLLGAFQISTGGMRQIVQNLTMHSPLPITLEKWNCSEAEAFSALQTIFFPKRIFRLPLQ